VLVLGANLSRANVSVRLELPSLGVVRNIVPQAGNASQLAIHLPTIAEDPSAMAAWAIGVYSVVLRVSGPAQAEWGTNSVPMALAPTISVGSLDQAAGTINLTVACTPRIRAEQQAQVRLLFGSLDVGATHIDTPVDVTKPTTLTFTIPAVKAGDYVVRLRVDGIDSLPVTYTGSPPKFAFDAQQTVRVT
jgi:hypothetical protein